MLACPSTSVSAESCITGISALVLLLDTGVDCCVGNANAGGFGARIGVGVLVFGTGGVHDSHDSMVMASHLLLLVVMFLRLVVMFFLLVVSGLIGGVSLLLLLMMWCSC